MRTYTVGQRILIADKVSNPNDYQTAHEVTVVETTDEWIKVKCDNTTRWYKTTSMNIVAELGTETESDRSRRTCETSVEKLEALCVRIHNHTMSLEDENIMYGMQKRVEARKRGQT